MPPESARTPNPPFCNFCGGVLLPEVAASPTGYCGPVCEKADRQSHWRGEILPTAAAQSEIRTNRAARMLAALERGPQTTWQLMQLGGAGFSSRLRELRVAGHQITVELREDHAVYTLERKP